MRTRHRSLATTTAGTLFALTLLTGCGGDDADNASAEPSATASSSPTASTSAPEPEETDTDSAQTGGETANAAFLERLKVGMGEEGSVHVDMSMTGPAQMSGEGDMTYGPDGSEMELTMEMGNMPGGAMEMIVVDDGGYMSIPGVTPPGKFFEVDLNAPAFRNFDQSLSPAESFKAFEAGLQEVHEVGSETIQGESTTHYRLEVNAQKAFDASGTPLPPGTPETLEYHVWLDSEDRMRRILFALAGTKVTMDMTDWGKQVTIDAPDKADIVKAPPVMGG